MEANIVTLEKSEYDELIHRIFVLENINNDYKVERDAVCDKNKVREIVRNYDDGEIIVDHMVNFDDVFEEISKAHDDIVLVQSKEIEDLNKKLDDRSTKVLELQLEIEALKNRGLWKRIFNKR